MGGVLDLRASPCSSIVMVPYQKGKRSLMAVVSILKMIRIPLIYEKTSSIASLASLDPSDISSDNILVGNDWWWFLFSWIPYLLCTWCCFSLLVEYNSGISFIVFFCYAWLHMTSLYSVLYWHRNMSPFRLIGAKVKFMVEVIPMIVAAALCHLLESDAYFLLLISCTAYFYIFAHFMHAAYDIGGKDAVLGVAMVVLVHTLNKELLVGALSLSFCLGLSFYRYVKYRAPELPIHTKKEIQLPC